MNRRSFLRSLAAVPAVAALRPWDAAADLPKAKVTRVRIYRPPDLNPLFNQSDMVVTVETDIGITGLGEGGTKDTPRAAARPSSPSTRSSSRTPSATSTRSRTSPSCGS